MEKFELPAGHRLDIVATANANLTQRGHFRIVSLSDQTKVLLLHDIELWYSRVSLSLPVIPFDEDARVEIYGSCLDHGHWYSCDSKVLESSPLHYKIGFNDVGRDRDFDDLLLVIDVKQGRAAAL